MQTRSAEKLSNIGRFRFLPRVPYAPTYANGDISATGDPIHFMFGSSVGFSGTPDGGSNNAIYDSNKSKMAATVMLEKF